MSEESLEDIDWELYKLYNEDLSHMNEEQLIIHYTRFGVHENRKHKHILPEKFDSNNYKIMNNDLEKLTDLELKKHYTLHGKREQRSYLLTDEPNRKVSTRTVENVKIQGITYVSV